MKQQHCGVGGVCLQPERHHPRLQRALPFPGEPPLHLAPNRKPHPQLPGEKAHLPSPPLPSPGIGTRTFTPSRPSSSQCGTINDEGPNEGLTERSLQDAQRLYLMNDVVQPESVDPLVLQDDVRFSNLVVDIVQGMDTLYHVMYISTGEWRERRGEAEAQ